MKKNKLFLSLVIFILNNSIVYANSLYETSSPEDHSSIYEKNNVIEESVNYLGTAKNKSLEEINPSTYGKRDITGKQLSFSIKNLDKISHATSSELIEKVSPLYRYNASLSYFGFSHDYSSKFKNIFYDAKKANSMTGSLVFSVDQRLYGDALSLNYLTGAGVSFFKGSGYFADDGSEADMRITLWILPVDFGLAGSYSFDSYVRLIVGGGLSGVAAIQSRSDLSEESDEKVLFQFGYGPFVTAKVNVGINKIFPKFSLAMFRDYGVTNTFFNIEYRMHNYSNFRDNFSIKGSAIGGGIGFNFM